MVDLPSRDTLAALTRAIETVTPCVIAGLARQLDAGRVETLYSCRFGVGSFVSPAEHVPEALRLTSPRTEQSDIGSPTTSAIAWHLDFAGAARVVSVPLPQLEPRTRLWWGLADARPLTAGEIGTFDSLAYPIGISTSLAPRALWRCRCRSSSRGRVCGGGSPTPGR